MVKALLQYHACLQGPTNHWFFIELKISSRPPWSSIFCCKESIIGANSSIFVSFNFISAFMISISFLVLILAPCRVYREPLVTQNFASLPLQVTMPPCIINQTLLYDEHLQNSSESPFVNRPILRTIPFGTTVLIVPFYSSCVQKSSVLDVNRCFVSSCSFNFVSCL